MHVSVNCQKVLGGVLFEYGYETDDAEEVKEGDVSVAEVGVVRDKFAVLNVDIAYYVQPMSKR